MRAALWIALAHTAFVAVLVPVYVRHYGVANFLWFSDVALLASVAALWLQHPLLAGMMALAALLPELAWNVDFVVRLVSGHRLIGLADYMFDRRLPRGLRALSFFHVYLPFLLVWMVSRFGYDRRAWPAQSVLGAVILAITFAGTDPRQNINWAFGPGRRPQRRVPPLLYLGAVMVFFPVAIYGPTHYLLAWLFEPPAAGRP